MKKIIHNAKTNKRIEIEMTEEELSQWETSNALISAEAQAKSALLEKLGITEDEAKLLLS